MEVAPSTQITFDLYDKLCKLSNKFKELFGKAKAEGPINAQPAMAGGSVASDPVYQQTTPMPNTATAPKFCASCGQPVNGGTFCNHCGAKL